jgi:hypothetical protein
MAILSVKSVIENTTLCNLFVGYFRTLSITKAGSRLVAYPRIVSVWTVPRIILPLQNVDTVRRNGLFAHLAGFSRRIKGTTRVASRFASQLRTKDSWSVASVDTQQVWTRLNGS